MKKLHCLVSAILLSSPSISLSDPGFVRTLTPYNTNAYSIGAEIQTDVATIFFAHGDDVYTALGVRPRGIKKLPDRAGNRDYVSAQTAEGRLAWSSDSSKELRPLAWPSHFSPPANEAPEIFTEVLGDMGIVWKSEKLKLVTTLPDRIEAITHFPESQRLAAIYSPRSKAEAFLEIYDLDQAQKVQTLQLPGNEAWSHVRWLDQDRLLLTFQGRVNCALAVFNIRTEAYELPRQTRNGAFELRNDTLWCVYSSIPKGDANQEEQVWPQLKKK